MRESSPSYAADERAPDSFAGDAGQYVEAADAWPRLGAFLLTPRTEAEVADAFHLPKAQATALLQRAVGQGLVRKLTGPTRFERIQAAEDSQASLFEP